jgi:hypothetical protein
LLIAAVEGIVYWWLCRFGWLEALALSITLNLASYLAGLALWHNFWGW